MSYAVCVTFQIKENWMEAFMPLMLGNARASLANEAGCLQFDVLTDPALADEVFLYELYTDRAAFDAHLTSDHFLAFDSAVADMIADKQVKRYTEVSQ